MLVSPGHTLTHAATVLVFRTFHAIKPTSARDDASVQLEAFSTPPCNISTESRSIDSVEIHYNAYFGSGETIRIRIITVAHACAARGRVITPGQRLFESLEETTARCVRRGDDRAVRRKLQTGGCSLQFLPAIFLLRDKHVRLHFSAFAHRFMIFLSSIKVLHKALQALDRIKIRPAKEFYLPYLNAPQKKKEQTGRYDIASKKRFLVHAVGYPLSRLVGRKPLNCGKKSRALDAHPRLLNPTRRTRTSHGMKVPMAYLPSSAHFPPQSDILFVSEAGKALMTILGLRVFLDGNHYL
ncbi:hypothetical protein EVAR_29264_1 [Eumeta japonica]|uniref:Uncharacterized protein n=1 Tax=Eumeta variegata TaxID=151549 RepID=A0A4C1VIB4_EUMVA|nr:hypothetical protein EVAR_29264_1 [Eumeta japonica]